MNRYVFGSLGIAAICLTACGGGKGIPASGERASGQSKLMDSTFAGKNKCDAKNHDRPFIIEWDATDMSSFESQAANDVVFVRYTGCDLEVVTSCRDDSVKGALGAYKPVEWTSGSLEKLDISNEGELYAKLPLGAATLGGRVEAGEQFHMEYYVSGTRTATRPAVYAKDLSKIPGCKGVTHFVYAYNLGAFGLGSKSEIKGEVGGSAWGFGAGGKQTSKSNAEKKGGDLASCKGESAKEVDTCKVPIRLALREIEQGDNPDAKAAEAPETPDAKNLAGKVEAKINQNEKAGAHWNAAREKLAAHDGKGCLKELDLRDKLDTNAANQSTKPSSPFSMFRAQCVMLAGQCDAGKKQYRKAMEAQQSVNMGPEQLDASTDAMAGLYCQGGSMSPRDQLIKASMELSQGAFQTKKDSATCMRDYETVKRLASTVKPRDEDDAQVANAGAGLLTAGPGCLARAGDCVAAKKVFLEEMKKKSPNLPAASYDQLFSSMVTRCKGK